MRILQAHQKSPGLSVHLRSQTVQEKSRKQLTVVLGQDPKETKSQVLIPTCGLLGKLFKPPFPNLQMEYT